eukprot:gnl/TRDRNA2_/TRDRNA2_180168_c0_seq1.p1 gnl/TRDRNA2_/TRDRNA2_180168_c0~~gnl/TRDRNA2_/TRDRNA2_180168_c0_seq1.p1  ORF type:complete len:558 (+),score=190.93 gnl/TRDRNA2_/TRDRNA2_180168_c0_seq1:90-1676(+)
MADEEEMPAPEGGDEAAAAEEGAAEEPAGDEAGGDGAGASPEPAEAAGGEDAPADGESPPPDGEAPAEGEAGGDGDAPAEAAEGEGGGSPPPPGDAEGAGEGDPASGGEEGGPPPDGEDGGDRAASPTGEDLPAEDSRQAASSPVEGGEDEGGAGSGDEEAQTSKRASPELGESLPEGGVDSAMVDSRVESPTGDEEEGMEGDEEVDEDRPDPLQELQEKYDQLSEFNERANTTNVALQRRVIQLKMSKDKGYDGTEKTQEGKVTEHKYKNVLQNVHSVRLKLRLQQVKAARMSEELKNQLEAKRQKAIECRDSFQEFKQQVARHAEYARTGKKIPEKIIREVEEFELDKDAEVEEVRGSNISLKNRLAKLEQALRKKDELAENLHVIDFEQLKIENQTLNEKIEERNEDLHKLRKKTIVTVQIITHMREKVQFVQQEYQALKADLAQLDQDLAAQRDLVAKTKHERDDYRTDNAKLRQHTGIINSDGLTKDYDDRTQQIAKLKEEIQTLKNRHKQMMAFVKKHGGTV